MCWNWPQESKAQIYTGVTGGWLGHRKFWTCAQNFARAGIRSLFHPPRIKSLYRMSYHSPRQPQHKNGNCMKEVTQSKLYSIIIDYHLISTPYSPVHPRPLWSCSILAYRFQNRLYCRALWLVNIITSVLLYGG